MKYFFLLSILIFSSISHSRNKKIKTGYWHSELKLAENIVLPVTFSLEKEKKELKLTIINADEQILLTNIEQKKDLLFVRFPMFDSELKLKIINKNKVNGYWYNYAKSDKYRIPFSATHGYQPRFAKSSSDINVYGKWEVTFNYNKKPSKAIGLFDSVTYDFDYDKTDLVKGTFLTETGDYRYLEGVITKDSLLLSTFDGSHAFLFRSQLRNDTLWGTFHSGTHYETVWYAVKNENFTLRSPDSLTYLVNNKPLAFSLPTLNNTMYNYPNEDLKNKVTLIQIMGTWCPNCWDESLFLAKQKETFKEDLEILSVTFETEATAEERMERVKAYQENLNLDFTFLMGGQASKKAAAELFPMLNSVISFPTLIFVDKSGNIRKIHTGFNGPGTGEYYAHFVNKTEKFLKQLISEKENG